MRERTRYGLSGALSLVAHGLFVAVFVWAAKLEPEAEPLAIEDDDDFEIDFVEFEVKEILPDASQGDPQPEPPPEPAPEETAPPPQPLPEGPPTQPEVPEPDPEAPPKPKFGEKTSKIAAMVPENATWSLMLANSRIKKLPFRDEATEIMAPLRDYQLLVDEAGFDVWEDFEFIVMGSPDFTDPTQAFVAVQYKFGHAEMKAGIDRACAEDHMVVDWREENGATIGDPRMIDPEQDEPDNRQFVLLPGDAVALYVREEFIPQIVEGPEGGKGKTSGNFVANIAKMRKFTQAEPKAGVQLVLNDLRSMIKLPKDSAFDVPDRIELMWEAAKTPELVVKIDFVSDEHAIKAEKFWNEQLEQTLRDAGAWLTVGGMIEATTIEREGKQIRLRHEFGEAAARITLQMLAKEFGKAMRYSKKEAEAAKQRREQNWEARKGGKLLPSQVLPEPQDGVPEAEPETAEPEPLPGVEEPAATTDDAA
ncbi:hypothetical protein ACNOYE_17375 [Nannocystaceae bacterium ST9]